MKGSLRNYLESQRRFLKRISFLEQLLFLSFVSIVIWQLWGLLKILLQFFFDIKAISWPLNTFLGLSLLILFLFAIRRWSKKNISIESVASEIEKKSIFFQLNPQYRSELVSAASFLKNETEFERAHYEVWENRLEEFKVQLRASKKFWMGVVLVSICLIIQGSLSQRLQIFLPSKQEAWFLSEYEYRLPMAEASWIKKRGAVSVVKNSSLRFLSPNHFPFKTYIFFQLSDGPWQMKPCHEYCEIQVPNRMSYAVGSLARMSPIFPILALDDEAPRPIIFLKEKDDLIPHPSLRIANRSDLVLELIASDDLSLKKVSLIRRQANSEIELFSQDFFEPRFKRDYVLDLEDWPGGESEVILVASDASQTRESAPLILFYEDEEFLREQRLMSIRSLLDQWVHVLADLLESERDKRLSSELFERLESIEWPTQELEGNLKIFVEGLKRLDEKIRRDLSLADSSKIQSLIERVEKQILYGLSLILQEKAGDLNQSTQDLNAAQGDLQSLLDNIKSGKEELKSEILQEAFEKLMKQIESLQDKIKNLPQGPSDQMINREALDEQLSQSEELQDKINEIQNQISAGNEAQALRELESLINQLSILSKEISRSFEQWQENLARGAVESSQRFEKKLEALRKRQEELIKKTDDLKEKKSAEQRQLSEKEEREFEKQSQDLQKQQDEIAKEFNDVTQEFKESLQGSEWEQVFSNFESTELEASVRERMEDASHALSESDLAEALLQEKESAEILKQMESVQQQARDQLENMAQQLSGSESQRREKVEIIESEGRGERKRRQKIMNSLKQKVDESFQRSHERYFEELLQR